MKAYYKYLNQLTSNNHKKYSLENTQSTWYNLYHHEELEQERNRLMILLNKQASWSFKNTKPWVNQLSQGCKHCGEGEWSCLFISGRCNAACFYCPTAQNLDVPPGTQSGEFNTAEEYAAYVKKFGFKGVSISGGEPLLEINKTLEYIRAVRKICDPAIYIWVYTNGILLTTEIASQLAEAGVDEIRFDIGATNYSLKTLLHAKGVIKNITVEIPAIPKELEKLKSLLPELISLGVTNLNLHQLRLTEYNKDRVTKKGYTFLHGEHPTSAESEITALKIMEHVFVEGLQIGVNYCSAQYKHRFQKAGYRKKLAPFFISDDEEVTENGYLRLMRSNGNAIQMNELLEQKSPINSLEITYRAGKIQQPETEIDTILQHQENTSEYSLLTAVVHKTVLTEQEIDDYIKIMTSPLSEPPASDKLFAIWQLERIEHGWRDFF